LRITADYKSAIQQITNLRYDGERLSVVHGGKQMRDQERGLRGKKRQIFSCALQRQMLMF
jgi:acetylglutamate kinase